MNTEYEAINLGKINARMERRVRAFGQPGLTEQECRAVIFSLRGLPDIAMEDEDVETPSQRFVAAKMGIHQTRVSQLLRSAEWVLEWFVLNNQSHKVGWRKRGATWVFDAPIIDVGAPIVSDTPTPSSVRIHRTPAIYKVTFGGELVR